MSGDKPIEHLYMNKAYVRIPLERIGVLIGEGGKTKKTIEEATGTIITVDSKNGSVVIEPSTSTLSPENIMKARDIVRAIGIGFPPDKALRLLEEDQILVTLDLKEVTSSPNHIKRIKSRIIGEGGRTRKIIEETTGTYVNIGEYIIGIIGDYEQTDIARQAVEMLIEGKPHSVVYTYLERMARRLKRKRITSLWK